MKKLKAPIFIGGEGRSGTRLLRTVIGAHPNIFEIQRETYIFASNKFHESLANKNEFDLLTLSILTGMIFRREMAHKKTLEEDFPEEALKAFNEIRDLPEFKDLKDKYDVFDLAIKYLTIKDAKERWVEKTPYNIYSFDEILDHYPEAKMILIFRDPRPVCASWFKKDPKKSLIGICLNWNRAAKKMNDLLQKHPSQVMMIRYEDLVQDSEKTTKTICNFIGEDFSPKMLEIDVVNSQYQERGDKGFSDHGFNRWKERLNEYQVHLINLLTKDNRVAMAYTDESSFPFYKIPIFLVFVLKEILSYPVNKFLKLLERN